MTPESLLFAPTHEWVALADEPGGGRVATVGVSAFALEALTDLVYIDLPKVGRRVAAGEAFGEIESVKAVSDLYSPVSGEVIEVHRQLPEQLETLSADPYGAGWIVKIRLDGPPPPGLLDYAAYQKQCAAEPH